MCHTTVSTGVVVESVLLFHINNSRIESWEGRRAGVCYCRPNMDGSRPGAGRSVVHQQFIHACTDQCIYRV